MRHEGIRIFEVARVSYLLANSKAVVSEYSDDVEIENDLWKTLVLSGYEDLIETCVKLVEDHDMRLHCEEQGYAVMLARDEYAILQTAL